MPDIPNADDQDQAEVLDETHMTPDGEDIANFDDIPDVLDVTTAVRDADEDDASDDDLDEEAIDAEAVDEDPDADLSPLTRLEDRPDVATGPGRRKTSIEDQIIDGSSRTPADFEA